MPVMFIHSGIPTEFISHDTQKHSDMFGHENDSKINYFKMTKLWHLL